MNQSPNKADNGAPQEAVLRGCSPEHSAITLLAWHIRRMRAQIETIYRGNRTYPPRVSLEAFLPRYRVMYFTAEDLIELEVIACPDCLSRFNTHLGLNPALSPKDAFSNPILRTALLLNPELTGMRRPPDRPVVDGFALSPLKKRR